MSKALLVFVAGGFVAASARPLCAQSVDSARLGIRPDRTLQAPDSTKPPISTKRAFLSSLILPGYGQNLLDRPHAAMLFSTLEVFSLGMAAKAAHDLRDVKSIPKDSVVSTYQTDPVTGLVTLDPKTHQPVPATWIKSRFDSDRVKARRVHYEDWIAALIFNHLFAAADAYVAANLWDFHANVAAAATPSSARIGATITW
jgi:hypothetical protein